MKIFDIETIPIEGLKDSTLYLSLAENIVPPAHYKKEETIINYLIKEKEKILEKAQLNPLLSQVAVTGIYDTEIGSHLTKSLRIQTEQQMLLSLFEDLLTEDPSDVIGFNTRLFDLPYMYARLIITKSLSLLPDNFGIAYSKLLYNHIDIYNNLKYFSHMSQDNIYEAITGKQRKHVFENYYTFTAEGHTRTEYLDYLMTHNVEDIKILSVLAAISK